MNIKEIIKLEGLQLENDQSMRILCPVCQGGSHKEKSLSITRIKNGIVYNCFRDSCTLESGIITDTFYYPDGYRSKKNNPSKFIPKTYEGSVELIPKTIVQQLINNYMLSINSINNNNWMYNCHDNHLLIPIYNLLSKKVGMLIKQLSSSLREEDYNSSLKEKSIFTKYNKIYYEVNHISNLYYPCTTRQMTDPIICKDRSYSSDFDSVFIVEDPISAVRVDQLYPCVSLQGTNLKLEGALELRQNFSKLKIVLDPDTWYNQSNPGIDIRKKYGILFNDIQVIRTDKEMKYMTKSEIDELWNS